MFGDGRENMQGQAGRMRVIHSNKFDARIHQCRNERQIARETIKLGYDQLGLSFAAEGQRPLKLRAIIALAGLDFKVNSAIGIDAPR